MGGGGVTEHSLTATMLGSSLAGVVARVPVYPLDTIKAKMQVKAGAPYRSVMDALRRTVSREGARGLYSGLGIAVVGSAPAACLYFTSFEASKRAFATVPALRDHEMFSHFAAGLLAETASCVLWVPIDVIKERLQVQGNERAAGGVPRYRGSWHALRSVTRAEGVRGLYRGYGATVSSFGPFSAFYLMFYERLKLWSHQRAGTAPGAELSLAANLANGAISGGLAAFITSPLDMAKLRIQVQRGGGAAGAGEGAARSAFDFNYRNVFHGVAQIARGGGIRGLWRGATARVAFMSPATAITIAAYEKCTSLSASALALLK